MKEENQLMKTFEVCAAQGDVLLIKIDRVPKGAQEVAPVKGALIVTHSETGHHHVVEASPNVSLWALPDRPLESFLEVKGAYVELEHLRPEHKHETLRISKGTYVVKKQREWAPEGWRTVTD